MKKLKALVTTTALFVFACTLAKSDQSREALTTGGFEGGADSWSFGYYSGGATTSSGPFQGVNAFDGQWYAYLGDESSSTPSSANGYMYQYLYPRPEPNALAIDVSFYLNVTSQDRGTATHDTLSVILRFFDDNLNFLYDVPIYLASNKDSETDGNPKTYHLRQVSYDLTQGAAGHWVTLLFQVKTDSTLATTFRIDDVSAKVRTPDPQYTVTSSAGTGGTISPSSSQIVTANGSVSFTATPDSTNDVDQWFVGGVLKQNGGTTYTLNSVTESTSVSVTFKVKTYTLGISSANGSVSVNPQLTAYPHGGEVTLTAYPSQNYCLFDWRGSASGVGNTLTFRMTQNMSILANFQPVAQPVSMQMANSTPAVGYQITIPLAPQMLHVFQCSDDCLFWRDLCVYDGNQPSVATFNPAGTSGMMIYRTMDVPQISTPRFLKFPVRNMTSRNAPVSSIFDHANPSTHPDGAIMTYLGEMIKITANNGWEGDTTPNQRVSIDPTSPNYYKNFNVVGYERDPANELPLVFNSQDSHILWYDGHNGYDYAVGTSEDVLAAADGFVVPEESDDCYNQICIDHGNGYRTYYLHLSERASNLMVNGVVQRVWVDAGQLIGHPGNSDCKAAIGVHLHFEVKRKDTQGNWVAIDPYGSFAENGDNFEPELWIAGQ